MAAATFDTLTATRNLESAGIERQHAEAIAGAMREAVTPDRDELATKAAATFDTLTATRNLESAGIERQHAEAIAGAMREAVTPDRDELATKADLASLRAIYRALSVQGVAIVAIVCGFIAIVAALELF